MQIPSSLFELFQSALKQETRRICRDAARILNIPQKELEEKIIKNDSKSSIHLITDKDTPYNCPVLLNGDIIHRCRIPCILGTGRCYKHQTITIPEIGQQKTLTRIRYSQEKLWCDESTKHIYNEKKEIVGEYRNNRIYLFTTATA